MEEKFKKIEEELEINYKTKIKIFNVIKKMDESDDMSEEQKKIVDEMLENIIEENGNLDELLKYTEMQNKFNKFFKKI